MIFLFFWFALCDHNLIKTIWTPLLTIHYLHRRITAEVDEFSIVFINALRLVRMFYVYMMMLYAIWCLLMPCDVTTTFIFYTRFCKFPRDVWKWCIQWCFFWRWTTHLYTWSYSATSCVNYCVVEHAVYQNHRNIVISIFFDLNCFYIQLWFTVLCFCHFRKMCFMYNFTH